MAIIDNGKTSATVRHALGIARREVLRAENGDGKFLWFAYRNLNTLIDTAENDRPGYLHHKVLKADYEEAKKLRDQVVALAEELGVSLNMFGR